MHESTINLQGLKIHYRMEGRGPDVILLHGWVSSQRMWAYHSARLAATHRCWSLDLPGCGDSDKPHQDWYSIPNYTAVLKDFAQAVGLRRAQIVGHSMGGMIAFDFAATHPQTVDRLVAINPVVTGRTRLRVLAPIGSSRPLVDLTLKLSPTVVKPISRPPLRRRLPEKVKSIQRRLEDFAKGTPDSIVGSGRAVVNYDVRPHLPRISAPTLVIVGEWDLVVPNSEGQLAVQQIPDSHLTVMRAGHVLTDDRPTETVQLVREFLT
jgi:pimeloyl-ACP methyl ester carboxylesterase